MSATEELIRQYKSIMYQEPPRETLHAGDIVHLVLDDFKRIVKHASILPVFEQFATDPNFKGNNWVVLNQPCNMVHDTDKNRRFKGNLFLAPLRGFRSALTNGRFGNLLFKKNMPDSIQLIRSAFKDYVKNLARTQNPRMEGETEQQYGLRIRDAFTAPVIASLERILATADGESGEPPAELFEALKDNTKDNQSIHESLVSFGQSNVWNLTLKKFQEAKDKADAANSKIILRKDSHDPLARLCLNQVDSQGIFFFEPHPRISNVENDLAFAIHLEEMLTVKINEGLISSGDLVGLLKEKRVLCLTENFSDRLLNIMGNYFSKIGTGDVMADQVLDLYAKAFKDDFLLSPPADLN